VLVVQQFSSRKKAVPLLSFFFLEVGERGLVEWEGQRVNCSDGSSTRRGSPSEKRRRVEECPGVVLNDLVKIRQFWLSSVQVLYGGGPALSARAKAWAKLGPKSGTGRLPRDDNDDIEFSSPLMFFLLAI